jgi:agmatinase
MSNELNTIKICNEFTFEEGVPPFFSGDYSCKIASNSVHLLGFEFDNTACFRKGAQFAPNTVRNISDQLETFSPYLNKDLEDYKLIDLGNIKIDHQLPTDDCQKEAFSNFEKAFEGIDLKKDKIRLLTIGGEHSISYAPIKKYLEQYPDLTIIHLDAHADLRDGFEGHKFSHASIIRRILDHFSNKNDLIQYGIRSGTKDEFNWMRENNTLYTDRKSFLEKVQSIDPTKPIYMTLDLDYFDPAYLPGTGTPEAGGEDFHSYISLIKILEKKNFVGGDIVELSSSIDTTGNSTIFASKVIRETILALNS